MVCGLHGGFVKLMRELRLYDCEVDSSEYYQCSYSKIGFIVGIQSLIFQFVHASFPSLYCLIEDSMD